jgi:hypothetical protein
MMRRLAHAKKKKNEELPARRIFVLCRSTIFGIAECIGADRRTWGTSLLRLEVAEVPQGLSGIGILETMASPSSFHASYLQGIPLSGRKSRRTP